jgi:hypothetical protein
LRAASALSGEPSRKVKVDIFLSAVHDKLKFLLDHAVAASVDPSQLQFRNDHDIDISHTEDEPKITGFASLVNSGTFSGSSALRPAVCDG